MELKIEYLGILGNKSYKGMLSRRSLLIIILLVPILCMAISNVSASISPDYVSYEKEPGGCYTEIKTVEIPGASIKVDVVFAFDLTSSMGEILNTAKSNIGQIMDDLINTNTGVSFNFGVISHMDYPAFYSSCEYTAAYALFPSNDYPYSLNQSLTDITTDVTNAIDNLSLGNGWDSPEDYTRIFYESYNDTNIGWRTDSQKLLINFADSVPHDCNLNEGVTSGTWSTGRDPGADEEMFTDDDLDLQNVLATMNSNDITLIECHSSTDYFNYWEYWTGITGGSVNFTNSSNFVNVVEEAIKNKLTIPKIYDLHLEVTTPGYESWLRSVEPSSYPEVNKGESVKFNETICVPADTPPGIYEFNVSAVDGDEINYGNQTNVITINAPPIANDDYASTNEDVSVIIDVMANDTDDDGTLDPSTVNVTSGPSDGITSVNLVTGEIEYTPDSNFYGSDSFNYTVDDDDGETSNEAAVTVTVDSVNDPPVITTSDDTSADEDALYSVDYDADDVDLDILTWSLASDAGFLSINPSTGVLSGTPVDSDVGSYYVNVTVADGNGGTDYSNFTLVVSDVNDPPDAPINPDPDDGATGVGTSVTLSVNVTDPDSDPLDVNFYDASDDSPIGTDTGVASGTTASVPWNSLSYSTTYSWYAIANDSEYTTKSDTWSFTTGGGGGGGGDDLPPNIPPIADASAGEPYIGFIGEDITFDGSDSYDPDTGGYIISWHWDFDDGTDGYGEKITHNYSSVGTYHVTLTVTDDKSETDTETFDVVISIANNAPEDLEVDGPLTGDQDTDYDYTASATDPDEKDMLRFIFEWGDGTTTTSDVVASGVIATVTHNWSKYGVFEVTVRAVDNYSSEISTTFTVLIDVIVVEGDITGLIIDEDGSDPYDIFNNTDTDGETEVELDNGSYLIDSDGDGKWDYAYDPDTGLITYYDFVYDKFFVIYEANKAPGFELLTMLAVIGLLAIILRTKRKNN